MGNIHVEKVEGGRLAPSTDLHLRICEWRNDHRLHAEPCGGMTIACKKDACVDIKNYPFQATRLSDSHAVSLTGPERGMQRD